MQGISEIYRSLKDSSILGLKMPVDNEIRRCRLHEESYRMMDRNEAVALELAVMTTSRGGYGSICMKTKPR